MAERKAVSGIGEISVVNAGQVIGLDLSFEDGKTLHLDFEHEMLPKLFHLLHQAGEAATRASTTVAFSAGF